MIGWLSQEDSCGNGETVESEDSREHWNRRYGHEFYEPMTHVIRIPEGLGSNEFFCKFISFCSPQNGSVQRSQPLFLVWSSPEDPPHLAPPLFVCEFWTPLSMFHVFFYSDPNLLSLSLSSQSLPSELSLFLDFFFFCRNSFHQLFDIFILLPEVVVHQKRLLISLLRFSLIEFQFIYSLNIIFFVLLLIHFLNSFVPLFSLLSSFQNHPISLSFHLHPMSPSYERTLAPFSFPTHLSPWDFRLLSAASACRESEPSFLRFLRFFGCVRRHTDGDLWILLCYFCFSSQQSLFLETPQTTSTSPTTNYILVQFDGSSFTELLLYSPPKYFNFQINHNEFGESISKQKLHEHNK